MECLTITTRELLSSHNVDKSKKKYMLNKRSQTKRIQTAWFNLHEVLNQAKWIHSDRKKKGGCWSWEESAWKEAQGNFWDEGHILWKYLGLRKYLDWSGADIGLCVEKQNSSNCTCKICTFCYIWILRQCKNEIPKNYKVTIFMGSEEP